MLRRRSTGGNGTGASTVALSFFCIALTVFLFLFPVAARADGISGYLEYNFSKGDTSSQDVSGTNESRSTLFAQRYRLDLNKQFFPTVTLTAGGYFQRTDGNSEADGVEVDQTVTKVNPYVDLVLNTPLLTLGGGYRKDTSWAKSNDLSTPKLVREQSYGRFGYRPDGFPTLDLQVGRNENYDIGRTLRDNVDEFINVSSRYRPVPELNLSYYGTFSKFTDQLLNNETRTIQNSGMASYSRNFWQNRAGFSGAYNILNTQSEFTVGEQGEVTFPLFPFLGLAALTDTPDQVILLPNRALIDGNMTAGTGIDIGVPPPLGDARPRNMGLDFVVNTEANTLYVWVDKPLPSYVANAYSWDIYTSSDNFSWTLRQTVSPAPFAPFDNRFEIRFQNVLARYLKVVTRPLAALPPPTVEYPDPNVFRSIQVTELQAFLRKPAAEVSKSDSRTSQTVNLDARVRILDVPSLYYNVSYFVATTTDAPSRYVVSNALSANHRFNPVFSGTARVSADYSEDGTGHTSTYRYDASLTAIPLKTLTHTLSYSGRTEDAKGSRSNFNSLYLVNTAEFYKGINANLSAGAGQSNLSGGKETRSYSLSAGFSLVPHRTLNMNLQYSGEKSETSGGGEPDASTINRTGTINMSYTPVPNIFLYGDWSINNQSHQPQSTTTNFTAGWTPFPGGTLHFNFPYTETRRSSDHSTDQTFYPSVRWNATRRISLDAGYSWFQSKSDFQKSRSNVYSTNFRLLF